MSLVNAKGVDVSTWNGDVDYNKLKSNGFAFVMIRSSFGNDNPSKDDNQFVNNVAKAEKAGIPWGIYHFSYAKSKSDALSEVAHVDRLLKAERAKGHIPTMPIAIDIEYTDEMSSVWNDGYTINMVAETFLDGIAKLGYYPMIYTGYDELDNMLSNHVRNDFDCWFAQWSSKPSAYKYKRLGMWQYGGETNYLSSPYIGGEIFDQNICYKDYPTIIKNGGYNGWVKKINPNIKKTVEALAFEVLDGRWSSENERKRLLTEAGYDYQVVQKRVNEICESWKNPTLDTKGYKIGESSIAILAIKELLIVARKLGIISQGVDENNVFGEGTLIAVNQILKTGKYNQNGIIGNNFVKYLSKIIKEKTNK